MAGNVKDTVILLVSSLVKFLSQMLFIVLMSIVLILYILMRRHVFTLAILGSLQDASSSVFQQSGNGRGGHYSNKPGWADYVSDLYKDSRDMGKMWCNAGKPRRGQIFVWPIEVKM